MSSTLFIHAVNVHRGGGKSLLIALLCSISPDLRVVLNVDSRIALPDGLSKSLEVRRIKKSVFSRLVSEYLLYREACEYDYVLCFGNLPPLLPLKAFTSVFVQNRFLIDRFSVNVLNMWLRLRIIIERNWLRLRIYNVDQYLVQTPSMQRLLTPIVNGNIPIIIAPFLKIDKPSVVKEIQKSIVVNPQFVYVASGEEHKNHRRLIDAWCLLADDEIKPELVLTIDELEFQELCKWIKSKVRRYNLKVRNIGKVDSKSIVKLYAQSDVLIYPSMLESFGLPLIEAFHSGLKIIASELDYVRDVVQPLQTFDPVSALSIARAVKRFYQYNFPDLQILSPAEFLEKCTRRLG
jgi:glycosyltransferase involved in cell wall biosynthesis